MPWKERGVIEERFRFIDDWRSGDWTVVEFCRHYEVTRATGYKWLSRYQQGGPDGLRDKTPSPLHHPNECPPRSRMW
jgi:putative transposase